MNNIILIEIKLEKLEMSETATNAIQKSIHKLKRKNSVLIK